MKLSKGNTTKIKATIVHALTILLKCGLKQTIISY